jgi:hypothetical protein
MSTEENKALVRREYEQGVNHGDFDVRNEVLASNYVGHFPQSRGSKPSNNSHPPSSRPFLTCKRRSRI